MVRNFKLFLAVFMFLSMTNGKAQTWSCGAQGNNLSATLCDSKDTLTISGNGDMADFPSNSMPWYSNKSLIKVVEIDNGVTSIGNYAFEACNNLTSVTIPNGMLSIGINAFKSCRSLGSVTFPSSVATIGSYAFAACYALQTVAIPSSVTKVEDYAFWDCSGLVAVSIPSSVLTIGTAAFSDCNNLPSVIIPNNVTKIGDNAFFACYALTSVTIGNSVDNIGNFAFSGCSSLGSVSFPSSLTTIGNQAFSYCGGLSSATIPNGVVSIGDGAFSWCSGLTSVSIPSSVANIGNEAFSCCGSLTTIDVVNNAKYSSLDGILYNKVQDTLICCPAGKNGTIVIPNTVKAIGNRAFYYCSNLTSITIPSSVTSIGEQAFSYCNHLESVNVDANNPRLSSVNGLLYSKMQDTLILCPVWKPELTVMGTITIPISITRIENDAFLNCKTLTSIIIPQNVTSIGNNAFYLCLGLSALTIRATVPPVLGNSEVFYNVPPNISVYVPCGYIPTYQGADGWKNFMNYRDALTDAPNNINIAQQYNSFVITWQDIAAETYEVYRNGALLATVVKATYTDTNLTNGEEYCYQIKAKDGVCEGELSDTTCQTFHITGIVSTTLSNLLQVFPNPTMGQLKIKNYELKENDVIEIYNVVGQKAPFNSPEGGKYSPTWKLSGAEVSEGLEEATIVLDISHLPAGMYFLKIGNKTTRFVKE